MTATIVRDYATLITGVSAALVALYAAYRWVRPRWVKLFDRLGASLDVIAGRPAQYDRVTGKQIADPILPLGERLDQENDRLVGALDRLAAVVESQSSQDRRLDAHEAQIADHEQRLLGLEHRM